MKNNSKLELCIIKNLTYYELKTMEIELKIIRLKLKERGMNPKGINQKITFLQNKISSLHHQNYELFQLLYNLKKTAQSKN
ncbi:hypothetical protein ACSLMH_10995 [Flavobacterium columnare]|uniref:hypothetical protein n=1 Tax=Flavobacterium TaxID=237 RepID=UPI000D1A0636|nr:MULTISPECIES: hypothetical protein [Flavobacterium]PTD14133.1 hypothetical protein C6N29_06655 [Flavobacterium columnare]PTD14148.1 hypothetical protein C6N29_06730 [Flavobacterium columnare]QYS90049.1 hypothetical protein JJC05_08085 [Flavobacterium davisii]QYS90056.1 hypothetical protein JJC05_08130 [Flavobacterium davisii]QYS90064.1 hypothetical protein JJC05_08175 [Flavobacterium davisii]